MAKTLEKNTIETIDASADVRKRGFYFTDNYGDKSDEIATESISFWKGAMNRLFAQKVTLFCMIAITLIILLAIFIPIGRETQAFAQNVALQNLPPKIPLLENIGIFDGVKNGTDVYTSLAVDRYYFFGTDELGRDIFLRIWMGIRTSLLIAFIVTAIELLIGGIIGAISGYFGGIVDLVIQRILEILSNIPTIIIVFIISYALGQSFTTLVISLSLFGWIGFSRLVRAQILKYKDQEFVLAARTLGAGPKRIMLTHLLPNMLSTFVVSITSSFPAVILSEAYYTVLALGLPAGDISLGQLIVENVGKLRTNPSQLIIPIIFMAIVSLAFNLFGNGLRDALDPKMKEQ